MFQYVWIREIIALARLSFSSGVGYLMLALSLSNLHFKSRPLDREESGDEILALLPHGRETLLACLNLHTLVGK